MNKLLCHLSLLLGAMGLVLISGTSHAQTQEDNNLGHLLLKGDPVAAETTTLFSALEEQAPSAPPSLAGYRYHLMQYEQPVSAADLLALRAAGIEPVDSLNRRALLVRTKGKKNAFDEALTRRAALAQPGLNSIRWSAEYLPALKISYALSSGAQTGEAVGTQEELTVLVHTWPGEPLKQIALAIEAEGLAELLHKEPVGDSGRMLLRTHRSKLPQIAAHGGVRWIEPAPNPTPRNDAASGIIQSGVVGGETLWAQGLTGEGQILGHIDGGIDMSSCFFEDTTNNTPGPGHRKVVAYRGSISGPDLHGTHTAGTLAGLRSGSPLDLNDAGHAYMARISHTEATPAGEFNPPTSLFGFLTSAQSDGAFLHTNSYGEDNRTDYSAYCVDIDQFMYENEDALVIFAATNQTDLRSPENAKNVLAVGNTQRAPNQENHSTGGFGPTFDGRRKPEIYAPGTNTISANTGSCNITGLTGTSMACPAITASGGLVRQYFMDGFYPSGAATPSDAVTPSGALVKAILLNSTIDLEGDPGYPASTDFTAPANTRREGWGLLQLDDTLYFDGEDRRFTYLARKRDELTSDAEGMQYELPFAVVSSGEELRVTFTWMEPAGALESTAPMMHNLDLEVVSPSGMIYPGNLFANGFSVAGSETDKVNNVEMVVLAGPETGQWIARARATSIDPIYGVPGFALVATGAIGGPERGLMSFNKTAFQCEDSIDIRIEDSNAVIPVNVTVTTPEGDSEMFALASVSASIFGSTEIITEGDAVVGNGIIEVRAGSTMTVSYFDTDVDGNGLDDTIALTVPVDCAAPIITDFTISALGETAINFSFDANELLSGDFVLTDICGGTTVTSATILTRSTSGGTASAEGLTPGQIYYVGAGTVQDAAGNAAILDAPISCFAFKTLIATPLLMWDFESIPDGFTNLTQIGAVGWNRVNSEFSNSPDHAWFSPNSEDTQDASLITPPLEIPAIVGADPVLRFWHTHQFEPGNWDGGVLEISTDAGENWADAGSLITVGGYTGTIRSGTSNPIAGQNAWTGGTLGSATMVEVDLIEYAGQTIQVRWRLGADGAIGAPGWYVDDVSVLILTGAFSQMMVTR